MARLSISKAWDETRDVFARDGRHIAIVAAAMALVPNAIASTFAPGGVGTAEDGGATAGGVPLLLFLIANILSLLGTLSITAITLHESTTVGGAIQTGARKLLPMIGALFLYAIPLTIILAIIIAPAAQGSTPEEMLAGLRDAGPGVAFGILAWMLLLIFFVIRFLFSSPVAVAETSNPVQILKRSWTLTSGNFWRLFAYFILLVVVMIVLSMVAGIVGGLVAAIVAGPPEPMSVSALVLGLVAGLATMVVVALSAVMTARLYAQAVSGDVSVPAT